MIKLEQDPHLNVKIVEEDEKRRPVKGFWCQFVFILAVGTTLFHIAALTLYPPDPWVFRGISLGLLAILTFILVPGWNGDKGRVQVADLTLSLAMLAVVVYLCFTYSEMYTRAGYDPTTLDWIFGLVATCLTIEMARRLMGWTLPVIAVIFILYAIFGGSLPGVLGHRGYEFDRLMSTLLSTEGIYGTAMQAASNYIVLFVAFGAFLKASGVGEFFIQFATALAGRSRGGPAKIAIFASALYGTVQGGAMQNVVTTGTFTIPLMKRVGYSPYFAGAVEAAASTGGQIMPPVMGAVAFVLAEATGTPYRDVMIAAIIPAVCYFAGVYFMVDFEAIKLGLKGMPRSELPSLRQVIAAGWHLLLPVFLLAYLIIASGRSVIMSALFSIAATVLVSYFKKETRIGWQKFLRAMQEGALGSLEAAAACGVAGIIVGVLTLTGLGSSLVSLILTLGSGNLPLTLFLIMIVTIILGMGMPTVPAYIIAASVGAPALVKLGIPVFVAHMFVMYFACISAITPPVALAAYAGAGVAKADPNRTGWTAARLSLAAYIVPYMFAYNPVLLWSGPWYDILRSLITVLLGSYALAAGANSSYYPPLRIVLLATAVMLIHPGLLTDFLGLVVLASVLAIQRIREHRGRFSPWGDGVGK